jgi:hypothetical protein
MGEVPLYFSCLPHPFLLRMLVLLQYVDSQTLPLALPRPSEDGAPCRFSKDLNLEVKALTVLHVPSSLDSGIAVLDPKRRWDPPSSRNPSCRPDLSSDAPQRYYRGTSPAIKYTLLGPYRKAYA